MVAATELIGGGEQEQTASSTFTMPPVSLPIRAREFSRPSHVSRILKQPTREVSYVDVGNPYDRPIRVYVETGQSNPLYRTYVQHKWLTLEVNETRRVQAMFEFAPDEATRQDLHLEEYRPLPNNVDLTAFSLDREVVPPADSLQILGGTDI